MFGKLYDCPYDSWRKVRPNVYCESFAARLKGKYGWDALTIGLLTVMSNAAYGKVMLTVLPPFTSLPSMKETLAFCRLRLSWRESFTR